MIFTDGSVKRGIKSGWAYTARVNSVTVAEGSGAIDSIATSIAMEVKAVTEALLFLIESPYRKAIIATDSISTLQNIENICYTLIG